MFFSLEHLVHIVKNSEDMHTFLYFIAIFCLSQSAHWVKWSGAAVILLGFWRLFLSALCWIPLQKPADFRANLAVARGLRSRAWLWAVAAGFLLFLHLWAFQFSAQHTHIANQMILFASNPLWTTGMAVLFFAEKPSLRLAVAYLLSLSGIAILVFQQARFDQETLFGDGTSLLAALLYSAYLICSRQARLTFSNGFFSLVLFSVAALFFGATCLYLDVPLISAEPKTWIAILGLTLSSTLLGHGLFIYLLKYLDIHRMSCGKLLEPVLASLTAYFIFSQSVRPETWWAFLFTAAGVLVLFGPKVWQRRQA